MKSILISTSALSLVLISFVFNSYLLAWCIDFAHSLLQVFIGHNTSHYSFALIGFSSILILLVIGMLDIPLLSKLMTNSRNPLKSEKDKVTVLLQEVLTKVNSKFPYKPQIFIKDEIQPNASAYGKKSLIIGKVLLNNYSDDEIKAVLYHEISHLINKEGLIILVIFWINMPMQIIMWIYQKYAIISLRISKSFNKSLFNIITLIPLIIFSPIIALNFIGKVLLNITFMIILRMFEYASDKFVVNYGYRDALISFLEKQLLLEQDKSIIDKIVANHPSIVNRIARLEKY